MRPEEDAIDLWSRGEKDEIVDLWGKSKITARAVENLEKNKRLASQKSAVANRGSMATTSTAASALRQQEVIADAVEQKFDDFIFSFGDTFPSQFVNSFMDEKGCFRSEVRDTGYHVCGVHTGAKWESPADSCPDAEYAADLAIGTILQILDQEQKYRSMELTLELNGHYGQGAAQATAYDASRITYGAS